MVFSVATKQHAQLYFIAEALGITEKIHSEIFATIQIEGNYLLTESDARDFFTEFGITGEQFDKAYNACQEWRATAQASFLSCTGIRLVYLIAFNKPG